MGTGKEECPQQQRQQFNELISNDINNYVPGRRYGMMQRTMRMRIEQWPAIPLSLCIKSFPVVALQGLISQFVIQVRKFKSCVHIKFIPIGTLSATVTTSQPKM